MRAAQREHGRDLLVGEEHDAAALADAMDADAVLGRRQHHRFHRPRPFDGRDLDPILAAVVEALGGVREVMGVAFREGGSRPGPIALRMAPLIDAYDTTNGPRSVPLLLAVVGTLSVFPFEVFPDQDFG